MIAWALILLVLWLAGIRFGAEVVLLTLAIASVGDAIRAQKVPAWTLTQRVDALSDAYAKGYRDARDEDAKYDPKEPGA